MRFGAYMSRIFTKRAISWREMEDDTQGWRTIDNDSISFIGSIGNMHLSALSYVGHILQAIEIKP
jgi:hypothetical protein